MESVVKTSCKFILEVDLQNPNHYESLPESSQIQIWCEAAIQAPALKQAFANSLSVLLRFVDIIESADLNNTYRKKQGPTNVLSFTNELIDFKLGAFELSAQQYVQINKQNSHLGDLVICKPLVCKEALQQGKSVMSHWAHLIIHGVLHLQGFDHLNDNDAQEMENLEMKILERLGFSNPYTK